MGIVLPCALQDGHRSMAARRGSLIRSLSGRLIAEPGKAFLPSQHRQHVENPGEVVRPVSATRSGWATAPSLRLLASAKAAHGGFGGFRGPWRDRLQRRAKPADQFAVFRRQQRGRFRFDLKRPVGKDEVGAVDQLDQRLGALLQARHRLQQLRARGVVELRLEVGTDPGHSSARPRTWSREIDRRRGGYNGR